MLRKRQRALRCRLLFGLSATLVVLAGVHCGAGEPSRDATGEVDGADGAPGEVGDGADGGGSIDGGDGGGEAGPLTFVVESFEAITDRVVDLDGDGTLDNTIADLGATDGSLYAMALSTLMSGGLFSGEPFLVHLPWVADVSVPSSPSCALTFFPATDGDIPVDPTDDLSGDEGFYAGRRGLDGCGEPVSLAADCTLDAGELVAWSESIILASGSSELPLDATHFRGTIEPHGASAELVLCAAATASRLGDIVFGSVEGRSMLELLLGGGALVGLPAIPGLSADLDVDGDGLERFVVDDEGFLLSCVDGDLTPIEGSSCFEDPRIADAFSLCFEISTVSARFLGPRPSWRWEVAKPCDEPPPEGASLWGPCEAGSCERWEVRDCTTDCGGTGSSTCSWDCSEWSPCIPDGVTGRDLASCEMVTTVPGDACSAEREAVRLIEPGRHVGGLTLTDPSVVGRGPVMLAAEARVRRGGSTLPGRGWAIVALLNPAEAHLGPDGADLGIYSSEPGYALEWRFFSFADATDERDEVGLRGLGTGVLEDLWIWSHRDEEVEPRLDSTTEGPVTQRLRLVIEPDQPETEENETAVVGQIGTEEGDYGWAMVSCFGDGCPVRVRPGDELVAGVSAADDSAYQAIVDIPVGGAPGFSEESRGLCP